MLYMHLQVVVHCAAGQPLHCSVAPPEHSATGLKTRAMLNVEAAQQSTAHPHTHMHFYTTVHYCIRCLPEVPLLA